MDPVISQQDIQLLESVKSIPAISIILPFEPKMTRKSELELKWRHVIERVQKDMISLYPAEQALPMIHKLQLLVRGLNYNTFKKSIAVFVSPMVEKVFYLDTPVEEKILVDESFQIRDLIYCKKQVMEYLLLLLSADCSKTFLVKGTKISLIKSNVPDHVQAYERDLPEKVGKFSDPLKNKQVLLDKFLHHMDEGLSLILRAYPYPVFVLGADRVLGHFGSLTHNRERIVEFIPGNYFEATLSELQELMQPHIADWKSVWQQDLLHRLQHANNSGLLSWGLHDVRKQVVRRNCRLLVVEKDFRINMTHQVSGNQLLTDDGSHYKPYYVIDAVDKLIETVLEFGGDIEFVDAGLLKEYGQIALITHF